MRLRSLQFFFFIAVLLLPIYPGTADLTVGKIYSLKFADINGNSLSSADGHISIVIVVTRATWPKAQLVGDRVPDIYLGDSTRRCITVVKFGQHSAPVRALLTAGARRRLNAEAKRVRPRYEARKISRDPRRDIFAVVDFDGTILSQLGIQADTTFRVFVFGRKGELLRQWNDAPSAEELAAVLK